MPQIESYEQMKLYCLRALGEDGDQLIKVNISEDQTKDRIDDAIRLWQDFHMEGSTETAIMKYIRNSDLKAGYLFIEDMNAVKEIMTPNHNGIRGNVERMDDLDYIFHIELADNTRHMNSQEGSLTYYHINMEYLSTMRHLLVPDRLFTFNATTNRLVLQGKYPAAIGGQLLEEFRLGNWNTGAGTTLDIDSELNPNDKLQASRIENNDAGINPIHCEFTHTTDFYPRGLRTFSVFLKQGTYTGKVRLSVKDRAGNILVSKIVQPLTYHKQFEVEAHYKEGHINDYIFELESTEPVNNTYFIASYPSGFRNNFIFVVGYQTSDPVEDVNSWNSGWLKSMCISLLKKQWAQNMKKYGNIQMAGGVTLNAQTMYDEAISEITNLKEELESKWAYPSGMLIG